MHNGRVILLRVVPLAFVASMAACVHPRAPLAAPATATPTATATTTATASTTTTATTTATATATATEPPAPKIELPQGGRELFPAHRLVGYCGTPGAPALGRLAGDLAARTKSIQSLGAKYAQDRKVLPLFELIAVVVQGAPGPDGKWRHRVADSVVDEYLQAARDAKGLLLLNIQPGQSDFMTEVKHFERYLREPDVGVALDPEWAMKPKQKPGVFYGQASGATINEVGEYLAKIVKDGDLPEKALVFHQMNGWVVKDEGVLAPHPGVVLIKSVDGFGPKGAKINTYKFLVKTMPEVVHAGFKLFFDEDTASGAKLMSPDEVLGLTPLPEYVMYE